MMPGSLSANFECYDLETEKCSPLITYIHQPIVERVEEQGKICECRNTDPHEEEVNRTKNCDESIRCGQPILGDTSASESTDLLPASNRRNLEFSGVFRNSGDALADLLIYTLGYVFAVVIYVADGIFVLLAKACKAKVAMMTFGAAVSWGTMIASVVLCILMVVAFYIWINSPDEDHNRRNLASLAFSASALSKISGKSQKMRDLWQLSTGESIDSKYFEENDGLTKKPLLFTCATGDLKVKEDMSKVFTMARPAKVAKSPYFLVQSDGVQKVFKCGQFLRSNETEEGDWNVKDCDDLHTVFEAQTHLYLVNEKTCEQVKETMESAINNFMKMHPKEAVDWTDETMQMEPKELVEAMNKISPDFFDEATMERVKNMPAEIEKDLSENSQRF